MAGPLYPNVPLVAGVPPVLRLPGSIPSPEPRLIRDSAAIDRLSSRRWGIFSDTGATVLQADSVVSVEHGVEYRVSDYPLEAGGFESYNKVATPFEVRVAMTKGGTLAQREAFLNTLAGLVPSLERFNVVTPEQTYRNATIISARLARSATGGAGMVTVEVGLQEIRQTATATFSDTKAPSGATTVNDGAVQPTESGINPTELQSGSIQ